jgi:hypothetical protein
MSGVGISFDRIYLVVEELNFSETFTDSKALFINYGMRSFYAMKGIRN